MYFGITRAMASSFCYLLKCKLLLCCRGRGIRNELQAAGTEDCVGRQQKCFPGEMYGLGLLLKVANPCSTFHTESRPAFMQKQSDAKVLAMQIP